MTSCQRVQTLLDGTLPDRVPHFDLLRNDAVISHLAGETLTIDNADRVVYQAINTALDGTRPRIAMPTEQASVTLPDGRTQEVYRWTTWTENLHIDDMDEYASQLKTQIEINYTYTVDDDLALDSYIDTHKQIVGNLDDVYLFWSSPGSVGVQGMYATLGLEQFSFFYADYPDVVHDLFASNAAKTIEMLTRIEQRGIKVGGYFLGEDIAFKGGTIFSPDFFRQHFYEPLTSIIDQMHANGSKVMYHSDGNLMGIIDDLVATGFDAINPVEVLAGMDVADIHRRHPHIIFAGAIDVSQLLPYGTPQQIADTVRRTVDEAEGRIMIGSSTELQDCVPLENYQAMYDTLRSITF